MRGRKATPGILASMAKSPHAKKKPPTRTWIQSIGFWLAATAIAAVGVLIVAAVVSSLITPPKSVLEGEADLAIIEIAPPPAGAPVLIVAGAVVEIQRRRVTIPLTAPQSEGLAPGTVLRVKYTVVPSLGTVRVDTWERTP